MVSKLSSERPGYSVVPLGLLMGNGRLSVGAQILTMLSSQDKLVFYTGLHLTERVQLLKILETTGLSDSSTSELLEFKCLA